MNNFLTVFLGWFAWRNPYLRSTARRDGRSRFAVIR